MHHAIHWRDCERCSGVTVFREVEWTDLAGNTVRCAPSLAMLRRMKSAGVSTLEAARGCLTGTADPLDLAECHAIMAECEPEESYAFLMSGDTAAVSSWQMAFVQSVMPGVDLGKKLEAPSRKRKAKPRAAK